MSAKLPMRELLRFMARAAGAAGQAARVVTSVADTIQGAPSDVEAQRQLRDLSELHQELELRAHQLDAKLEQLATDDAGDDERLAVLETQQLTLERRVRAVLAANSQALEELRKRVEAIGELAERATARAAAAGAFRQLEDDLCCEHGFREHVRDSPACERAKERERAAPLPLSRQREG